jgi:hypothetical protein
MFTKVYWIEKFENGAALGIMPRPRGNDWLEDEIKVLAQKGVGTVVSLLEKDEIQELGLREEGRICRMGIGRASIIAGAVLLEKGTDTQQVMEKITKARELKVPDTEEQVLWLKKREG